MPGYYANCNTVSRQFQQWCQRDALIQLANALREEEAIDERESFIDATFAQPKRIVVSWADDGFNFLGIVINHARHDALRVGNVACTSHPFLISELY